MKKILVTGSAGFIGHHVSQALINKGFQVIGIDSLNSYYDPQLKFDRNKAIQGEGYEFHQMDLCDFEELSKLFETHRFEFIIHLAAQAGVRYSISNPRAYIHSNVEGFFNVLDLSKKFPPKHLIYASSSSVYGDDAKQPFTEDEPCSNPVSFYAATKRSNEVMAASYSNLYHLTITGLRFFTVYGPWGRPDMAPILFADAARKGETIKVFNHGKQKRDFTYVSDIVENIIRLTFSEKRILENNHSVFNIGNGSPVGLMDFIDEIESNMGVELKKEFVDAQPGDVTVTFANTSKLESYTNFSPKKSIKEGIPKFINWYKKYYFK